MYFPSSSTDSSVKCEFVQANGRKVVRLTLPPDLVCAFACLQFASISLSRVLGAEVRRGSRNRYENCFSGMAGQLAVVLALRHFGLDARMLLPTTEHDRGYDITFGEGSNRKTIDVKTSSFTDNRGFERVGPADRMPWRASKNPPDFYFWCVTEPYFFRKSPELRYVDLVAAIPGAWAQEIAKPATTTAVPGICFRSFQERFSLAEFLEEFEHAPGTGIALTPRPTSGGEFKPSTILHDRWVLENILPAQSMKAGSVAEETVVAAETQWAKVQGSP